MLAICEFANRLSARGHVVNVVAPRIRPGIARVPFDPSVRLRFSSLPVTPLPNRHLANALLALDLARITPPSDALVATYTPTAIPTILTSLLAKGRRYWIYADYDEMFSGRPIERQLIRHLPRHFQAVITYAATGAEELARVAGTTAEVVPPGLPRERYFRPAADDALRHSTVLYVGDSRPRKGLNDFLHAAELAYPREPSLRLRIVTKEPFQFATSVPLDYYVAPDDSTLGELYRSSRLFVSTAWYEGLGLPPLEAMASGVPVVVTDQRGCRDYAIDGENCLKVPIQRPDLVAEAMLRILADRNLAQRLTLGGYEAAARYRWDTAVDRLETILSGRTSHASLGAGEWTPG